MIWVEAMPLCGRIKIRCYDMGGGYDSCGRIKINLGEQSYFMLFC